ncbi:glycosyltransferase family 39 protein [Bradyrhizobium sp. ARR65]|uniref:glycosyltransferase family 39 protein n=1 Tax=Bradyrhizobium sp. ARR65 TaxID=1040989 RepID=UPI000463B0DC|nr:glycosyltransferase family 39 protein [Bradyrhizobium sp. ARR65]
MRFTSLAIELIRARPRLVVWIVALAQAALWLTVALLFYRSPPPNLAIALAYGREYQVGTEFGPPLAFWLGDIAYRAAGNHIFGVYLLAVLCSVAAFWILFLLGRALVGGQHAVLAVLLTMTVTAFGAQTLEFGPAVLARPLWALLLLHSWELIGQQRRNVWFAWSIDAGLLLLTSPAAAMLLLLVAGFALATDEGRRMLRSLDPLFALLVVVALALPYLVWLMRAEPMSLYWSQHWPTLSDLGARARHWGWLLGWLLFALVGIVILVVFNSRLFAREGEDPPSLFRPPAEPLAYNFVYFFAIVPPLLASLIAGLFGLDRVFGGAGVALLMSGLAVVVTSGDLIRLQRQRMLRAIWAAIVAAPTLVVIAGTLFLPWTSAGEVATTLPARAMAQFFTDSFSRRTSHQLEAVAGDTEIASLIALGPGRPHLFVDASPQRTPWMTAAKFNEVGGVVVWRASDTSGAPPPDIAQRFPNLVPEVPRSFDRLVNGRQGVLRIGWAIVRPKGQ